MLGTYSASISSANTGEFEHGLTCFCFTLSHIYCTLFNNCSTQAKMQERHLPSHQQRQVMPSKTAYALQTGSIFLTQRHPKDSTALLSANKHLCKLTLTNNLISCVHPFSSYLCCNFLAWLLWYRQQGSV